MRRQALLGALLIGVQIASAQTPATAPTAQAKPSQPAFCSNCHTNQANQVAGYFNSVAFKSQSMQLDIGSGAEILRFDPKALKVLDAGVDRKVEHLREVKARHEVRIDYVERDGVKYATQVSFKGPIKIDPAKLIGHAAVAKLVALGPEKGGFTLVDSRPPPRFEEGAIPGAINVPFIGFDKFANRLPKDKASLVIFYCGGVTCTLSPNSLRKAETLGFTNVRVYREGMPDWQTHSYAVLASKFLKSAFIDKDIPHVLLDARTAEDATSGHIPGAVSVPPAAVPALLKGLPDPALKAPIVVYDGRGGEQAAQLAQALVKAGQHNVAVLDDGMVGWQSAGLAVESGRPAATRVAYAPKPRPGSIAIAEFNTLARKTPADVLILDVRNPDEANAGMIKGALLLPDEEIAARLAEIPKDKRIIAHCSTGIRAEMAYHKLKEAGYNASFLHGDIAIAKDGSFKVTAR